MVLRKKLTAALLASTMVLSGGIGNLSVFNEPTAYAATVSTQTVPISTTPKVTTTSTNTSVTLKCEFSINDISTIYYNVYDSTGKLIKKTSNSTITISNLKPNTTYKYSVQCECNANGQRIILQSNSKVVTVKTTANYTQSCNLTGIAVTAVTANSVTLTWKNPSKTMTNFNGYIKSNKSWGSKKVSVKNGKTSLTISGLKAGQYYELGVKGWNTNNYTCTNVASIKVRTAGSTDQNGNNILMLDTIINQLYMNKPGYDINATFGCGGTCLTMLMNSQKNANVTKNKVLSYQYNHSIFNNGDGNTKSNYIKQNFTSGTTGYGTCLQDLEKLAKAFGYIGHYTQKINYKNNTIPEIDAQLKKGHLVIVGLKLPSGSYHYEVVYGKKNGNYLIANPYGAEKYEWSSYNLYTKLTASLSTYITRQYIQYVQGIFWLD